jgi:hypothetical protein
MDSSRGGSASASPLLAEASGLAQEHGQGARATRRWRFAVGAVAIIIAGVLAFLLRPTLPPPRVTGSTQVTKDGREKDMMVTDGSRIYLSSWSGLTASLYRVPAAGGDATPVQTSIHNPIPLDISPDRSELLVGSCDLTPYDCALWTLPVLGGSSHSRHSRRVHGRGFSARKRDCLRPGSQLIPGEDRRKRSEKDRQHSLGHNPLLAPPGPVGRPMEPI